MVVRRKRLCHPVANMDSIAEGTDLWIVADDGADLFMLDRRIGKPGRGFRPKTCRGRPAWRRFRAGRSGAASVLRLSGVGQCSGAVMWDAIVLGAGAAGLMCAIEAARRGRRVLVLDHARAAGEKIRISGGGRCNFTNLQISPDRFLSQNPRFARSALSRYTQQDFIDRLTCAGIAWHEKTLGQLFCDGSARQIVDMLLRDLHAAGGELRLGVRPGAMLRSADGAFRVETDAGAFEARAVVLATGGKSIPKMGASDFGYRVAEGFGLRIVPTRPALVPLVFTDAQLEAIHPLAGLSVQARVAVEAEQVAFQEGLLFTHRAFRPFDPPDFQLLVPRPRDTCRLVPGARPRGRGRGGPQVWVGAIWSMFWTCRRRWRAAW